MLNLYKVKNIFISEGGNINFKNDLCFFIKREFNKLDIKINEDENIRNLLIKYLNTLNKLIEPIPRKVYMSKKLENKDIDKNIIKIIDEIKVKFKKGININPHLSKKIFKPGFNDYLLDDWGIYHLHLSCDKKEISDYFYRRADYLLFVLVDDKDVYFIDILKHNLNYVFSKQKLLKVIDDNWPNLLKTNQLNEVDGLSQNLTDKEINDLRKSGINVLTEVGDKVITSLGGGLTTAGTNILHTRDADFILNKIRRWEEYIKIILILFVIKYLKRLVIFQMKWILSWILI